MLFLDILRIDGLPGVGEVSMGSGVGDGTVISSVTAVLPPLLDSPLPLSHLTGGVCMAGAGLAGYCGV